MTDVASETVEPLIRHSAALLSHDVLHKWAAAPSGGGSELTCAGGDTELRGDERSREAAIPPRQFNPDSAPHCRHLAAGSGRAHPPVLSKIHSGVAKRR